MSTGSVDALSGHGRRWADCGRDSRRVCVSRKHSTLAKGDLNERAENEHVGIIAHDFVPLKLLTADWRSKRSPYQPLRQVQ